MVPLRSMTAGSRASVMLAPAPHVMIPQSRRPSIVSNMASYPASRKWLFPSDITSNPAYDKPLILSGWAQTSPITAGLRDPRVEYADSQLPNVTSAARRTGAACSNIDSGSARLTMMSPTAATRTSEPIVVSLPL